MKTVMVSDGDINIDVNTGRAVFIEDLQKAGQDVAEAILTEFNSFFQEGNEFMTSGLGKTPGNAQSMASQWISEAINRVIVKQTVNNFDDKITGIRQLKTQIAGNSNLAFFVEVEHSSNKTVSIVDYMNMKPTSLKQVLDYSGLLKV